ncbi:MAG: hypothetical protein AB8B93_00415 [Pseudomonadales bacterium]
MFTRLFSRRAAFGLFTLIICSGPAQAACSGDELIDVTLPSGSRWDLCWQVQPEAGVTLSEIYFTTPAGLRRRVLNEASLAQVHVRFDDARTPLDALTDFASGGGFGAAGNLVPLQGSDCPGGTVRSSAGQDALCQTVEERGYAYKSYSVVNQGHMLVLASRAKIGAMTFVVRWRLYDDGGLEPAVGVTGGLPAVGSDARYGWALDATGRIGVGFHTSVHWRLDFDLGADAEDDRVEQFEVAPSADRLRKNLSVSAVNSESALVVNPDLKRSWRVVDSNTLNADQRPVSYHLEPLHVAHRYPGDALRPWQQSDLYVTRYNPCERFINDNSTANGCGGNVTDFVNGEALAPGNVVLWYRVNYHHLPSSEDEPGIGVRWNGFLIVPRDWTSVNPLARAVVAHGEPAV